MHDLSATAELVVTMRSRVIMALLKKFLMLAVSYILHTDAPSDGKQDETTQTSLNVWPKIKMETGSSFSCHFGLGKCKIV